MAFSFTFGYNQALGTSGGTTSAFDSSGADCLFVVIGYGNNEPTFSDNKSNSWTKHGPIASGFGHFIVVYEVASATVGTGHTLTATAANANIGIAVVGFSGGATSSIFDQIDDSLRVFGSTVQVGPITPSQNGSLCLAYFAAPGDTGTAIDESYILEEALTVSSGVNFGVSIAYKIQTTATSTNPTWTATGDAFVLQAILASYKPAAGGGGPSGNPWYYYRNL